MSLIRALSGCGLTLAFNVFFTMVRKQEGRQTRARQLLKHVCKVAFEVAAIYAAYIIIIRLMTFLRTISRAFPCDWNGCQLLFQT
jgi:hypothetical protein